MIDLKQTDLSKRLRQTIERGIDANGMRTLLAQAADEIERYYTGMLNWKATAEAQSRTQPEATAPAQDLQLVVATSTDTGFFHVVINVNDGKRSLVLYDKQHSLNGDTVGVADIPAATAQDMGAAILATCTCPSGNGSLRWPCPQHPPLPVAITDKTGPNGIKWYVEPNLPDGVNLYIKEQK